MAYEFYSRDESGTQHLIGIVPERRMDAERITEDSILNWAWGVMGNNVGVNDIHFVRVEW